MWWIHVKDSYDLIKICLDTFLTNHVAQELPRSHSKSACLGIKSQSKVSDPLEEALWSCLVICLITRLHNHIIHIDLNIPVHHVMKQCSSCSLIGSTCVLQLKRHDSITVGAPLSDKRCLLPVLRSHHNLVITIESIHKRQHCMPCTTINQLVNMWERKIILGASLVEISKVHTNSNLAVLFGNRDDIS